MGGLGDLASLLDPDWKGQQGSINNDHQWEHSLFYALDHAHSHGLPHVADGETTKRRVLGEGLDTHGLGWNQLDHGGITGLDELGVALGRLVRAAIDLLEQLGELAGDVSSVAVEHGRVSGTDLAGVVHDDDLRGEAIAALGRVLGVIGGDVTTTDLLHGNVLDVETDVVARKTFLELLVVHLDRLDFGGDASRSEGDDHARLDDTGLDTADRNRANTTDLVHILEGQAEGLVGGAGWLVDGVDGVEQSRTLQLHLLKLAHPGPALVPWAVVRALDHVVTVEAGDGHEGNLLGVEADLLDEVGRLLLDLLEAVTRPFSGVHLVDSDDELLDTQGVGEESVLASLAILGDTGLELTSAGGNDENGAIGLRGARDHVLDEVTVAGGVNDGDIVLLGLELPESDVDGDTALTLGLELVEHPCVLEGALAQLGGFL